VTFTRGGAQVAIIGMGCTRFSDHWDRSLDDLLVDAVGDAIGAVPGLELPDVEAFWFGTAVSGQSGMALAKPLKLENKPITRVENMCATGSDALRNACYAVAAGAYDVAMAVGGEKLKDSDTTGLVIPGAPNDGTAVDLTAPAMFSFLVPAYCRKYGIEEDKIKEVLTRIAWKNHANGAKNLRAHFQREVDRETIACSPIMAGQLGIFDCSGISDGAAAAIICRAEDVHRYTDDPMYVRALSLAVGDGTGPNDPRYDYTTFPEVAASAAVAYEQAGIGDPATQIDMAEVHDCFTPTEMVLMEDLGFSPRGQAWQDILAGRYDLDGALPVNPDGGLKSFGHPIGASGLRMLFEMWLQLRGEAGARQLADPHVGLTHNLGGQPGEVVSFVSIVSDQPG
jgi:acetyl-CoA C-acetyltransferase